MPYEAKAEGLRQLGISLDEQQKPDGERAYQNGVAFRKSKVEHHVLRMIKRQEIPVVLVDYRMQGHPLDDRSRLDEALTIDIGSDAIGFYDLGPGHAWEFQTDTLAVLARLDARRTWNTNRSANDWLLVERYLRALFETRGVPQTRDEYFDLAAAWYAARNARKREPAKTELRALTSVLYDEYSFSEK